MGDICYKEAMRGVRLKAICIGLLAIAVACGGPPEAPTGTTSATPPTVLLISMDGFRWDHPELADTPNLDRLIRNGVRAEGLIPVFPSKTFPAHYSVVTGLHPGKHGVISNNMRDPRWPDVIFGQTAREEVQKARWWGGEPIWVTAHEQGLQTAVYFWPGSEAPIQGVLPDTWFPYHGSVPWDTRIATTLEWLDRAQPERPEFIALYFEEPNRAGHRYGPEAAETIAAVTAVDAALGQLLDGLETRGLMQSTNIVVVSDHGMALNDPERVVFLDDYVQLSREELFEAGALLQIFPSEGRDQEIYDALVDAHPRLRVFRPWDAPSEFFLENNARLAPIMGSPDPGWEVLPRAVAEGRGVIPGDHGQDPSYPDMHGIFVASGPAFREGVTIDCYRSVDIYNVLAAALGLDPAVNDGDPDRAAEVLRPGR